MTRRQQADELLVKAVNILEVIPEDASIKDNPTIALLLSLALSSVANGLLQQESLDTTIDLITDDDDDEDERRPW